MAVITLQVSLPGGWVDAARLEVMQPALGAAGPCHFEYDLDYFGRFLARAPPLAAVSVHLPVEFGPTRFPRWPAFLDDIRPLGSARAWWLRRRNLEDGPGADFELLASATVAPIGNVRVKEALPPKEGPPIRFPRHAVVEREHGFLEYAADLGASIGGATGAGGDSPKVLVRLDASDQVWIDTWQDEPETPDRAYVVKFARGDRTSRDRTLLRSEHVYYRALHALGVDTVDTSAMMLSEHDAGGPSLWLPRFDIERTPAGEVRLGMESMYSLVGASPGAFLTHQDVLAALRRAVGEDAWPAVLVEYVRRDLLNLVFGNADNHGRNLALLKTQDEVRLAPVYDFAPMKMDPEGIIRTTRWADYERGGVDWPALLASLEPYAEEVRAALADLAGQLVHLPELLGDLGLPDEALSFPAIGLRQTKERLRAWKLL